MLLESVTEQHKVTMNINVYFLHVIFILQIFHAIYLFHVFKFNIDNKCKTLKKKTYYLELSLSIFKELVTI